MTNRHGECFERMRRQNHNWTRICRTMNRTIVFLARIVAASLIWSRNSPMRAPCRRNQDCCHSFGDRVVRVHRIASVRSARGQNRPGTGMQTNMTSGANSKFVTRFLAVAFVGLAFAGCAMMFMNSEKSLYGDQQQTISAPN